MNDIENDSEIRELTDKIHTHKLKIDLILFSKYLILSFSILMIIILTSSIFW